MIQHQVYDSNPASAYYQSLCDIHPFLTRDIIHDIDYVKCHISEYPELYSQLIAIAAMMMGIH
jgi:hypothetical protein